MTKKPFLVFGRPNTLEDDLLIISLGVRSTKQLDGEMFLEGSSRAVLAPAGVGTLDNLGLMFHEKPVLLMVCTKETVLNLEDFNIEKIDFDLLLSRQSPVIIEPIELLIRDYSLDSLENHVCRYADSDYLFDLSVVKPKFRRQLNPLNRVFNSRSRQKIKHFIRRG